MVLGMFWHSSFKQGCSILPFPFPTNQEIRPLKPPFSSWVVSGMTVVFSPASLLIAFLRARACHLSRRICQPYGWGPRDGSILCLIQPGRFTWNLQITHLERKMIFQTSMIVFHVNLQKCMMHKNVRKTSKLRCLILLHKAKFLEDPSMCAMNSCKCSTQADGS